MANSKQVVKLPRFLVQPITWNASSAIGNPQAVTVASSPGLSLHLFAPKQKPLKVPNRPLHTSPAIPRHSRSSPLSSRSYLTSIARTPPSSTNIPRDVSSASIRHNGVYVAASVRLDLNLEKGRIREEANGQEMRIKETETRIEQEVAGLRERVEAVKFSTLQWLMGVCTGTAALILGAWRLLM
ncbi:DUF1640 domain-containing protein [Histoplasma capsulatum H143]|uniref:DUF1640 domain-containing protein n=1 Tax=Ajellomyces capsulatus (strain H143) TaxID=544712 RepID=C6H8Q3_AJECH|nr:DUF1640 domain-containing protein [Histoplasma capsulatum H143]